MSKSKYYELVNHLCCGNDTCHVESHEIQVVEDLAQNVSLVAKVVLHCSGVLCPLLVIPVVWDQTDRLTNAGCREGGQNTSIDKHESWYNESGFVFRQYKVDLEYVIVIKEEERRNPLGKREELQVERGQQ